MNIKGMNYFWFLLFVLSLLISQINTVQVSQPSHTNNDQLQFKEPDISSVQTVYAPWEREVIYSDIGADHRGYVVLTDIENDGSPELIFPAVDNMIFIVNYTNGNYHKTDLTIPEVSGKTTNGVEVLDYDGDGIKEIYLFTYQDMGSYWQSQIWQGIRQSYDSWSWTEFLTYNSENNRFYSHYACDYDEDGLLEIIIGSLVVESVTDDVFLIALEYNVTSSNLWNTTIYSNSVGGQYSLHSMTTGDLDNNGINELYSIFQEGTGDTTYSGLFQHTYNTTTENWNITLLVDESRTQYTLGLPIIGDGDNDGENELFYSGALSSELFMMEYDSGSYTSSLIASRSWNGHYIVTGIVDINHDGLNELVVGQNEVCCDSCIYIFNGSGSTWSSSKIYEDWGNYLTGRTPIVVDLDKDGQMEVYHAVGYPNYQELFVYRASGFPAVPTPPQYYVPSMTFHLPFVNGYSKLEWNPTYTDSLQNYHLQISDTHNFSSIILDNASIPADTTWQYLPETLFEPEKIFWFRVSAINGTGEGTFSIPYRFRLEYNVSLESGLIFDLPIDEGTGDTTSDRSGNNHSGSIHGASWVTGIVGSALEFDGDDYVQIDHSEDFNFGNYTDFTLSMWIKTTSTVGRVFSKGCWTGIKCGYMIRMHGDGTIRFEIITSANLNPDGPGSFNLNTVTVVNDGNWHFITAVVDRDIGGKIYVDGLLDAEHSESTTVGSVNNTVNPTIGVYDTLSTEWFTGTIDEYRLYNRSLNIKEIEMLNLSSLTIDAVIPWSSQPSDQEVDVNQVEVTITWQLYDDLLPGEYSVFRNTTQVVGPVTWTNDTDIVISVETGLVGLWNYTINYTDDEGNIGLPDTVWITVEAVIDIINPWSSQPADQIVDYNQVGVTITWQLYDDIAPGAYSVFRNMSLVTGPYNWSNGTAIVISVDTSSTGLWNYTIIYDDLSGNPGNPYTVWIKVFGAPSELPTVPYLSDPGLIDDDGNFTVSWTTSTDSDGFVDHYELQISNSSSFDHVIQSWTPITYHQTVLKLIEGQYYFRIRAVDNDGLFSEWSNTVDIQVSYSNKPPSTPLLEDPGVVDTDGRFTVIWSSSNDSDGYVVQYELQMSCEATFESINQSWMVTTTQQSVSGLPNGPYFFRVRAIDNEGIHSDWSFIESIIVQLSGESSESDTTSFDVSGFPFLFVLPTIIGLVLLMRKRQK